LPTPNPPGDRVMMFFIGFPLLLIPFAIYNIVVFLMPGVSFTEPIMTVPMLSGAEWKISLGDVLVMLGILLLFLEILKATRLGMRAILDHMLSLLLFIFMLGEFVISARVVTSTFFVLVLLSFVDVISGFSVTIRTAQRDMSVEGVERMQSS
jgi:hypothetical protein